MTTPKPDDVKLDQLPSDRRRYIGNDEISELRAKGFRIYTGSRQGLYIDATAEWLDSHAQKGLEPITDPQSLFVGLVPHPEHGENIYEYENGDHATRLDPPKGDDGEPLKRKKDKNGNDVIITHNHTRNSGNLGIPAEAVEVHVSVNPNFPVQAKWRNPTTGVLKTSYSHAKAKELREDHWTAYRANRSDITKGVRALRRMSSEELSQHPTDACLALVGLLGIRHGGDERIHEDGGVTGSGALDLKVEDFKITGDSMIISFRGKRDRPQRLVKSNKKVATAIQSLMQGKAPTDKIFNTTKRRNALRLKELTGNDSVKVKDLRTDYANYIAQAAISESFAGHIKKIEGDYEPFKTEKEFKEFQEEIGLEVGKALGHKKKMPRKNRAGKIMYESDGKTPQTEFVSHHTEAITSYIDPEIWEPFKPKQDIQNAHTPDWHEKTPMEERDIDEYAEARRRKGENRQWGIREFGGQRKPLVKTWMESLSEQGFVAPVIKQTTAHQMWFLNNGVDYVGTFGLNGDIFIEKAVFKPTFNRPGISYSPAGRNRPKEDKRDVQSFEFDEEDGL